MKNLLRNLYNDEAGAILSAEFIIIATVVILALITGWNFVQGALVGELADVASAFGSLDQSYSYRGVSAVSNNGTHATCSGGGFVDSGNQIGLTTNTQAFSGGVAGGGFTAGGGAIGFSGGATIAGGFDAGGGAQGFGFADGGGGGGAAGFAAPASPQGAALSEGVDTRFDAVPGGFAASADGVEIGRRLINERAATSGDNAAAANSRSADQCDELKNRIRELCKFLDNSSTQSQSPTRPQGQPQLVPIPLSERALE